MEHILKVVGAWIVAKITAMGYFGVALMMGIESACIPLPSEIIMPFSGYLVLLHPDQFSLIGMGVAGAVGCVVGSLVAYYAGLWGGRPFIERYGKYVLLRTKDLDKADKFFAKYGNAAIFISRLLPVVRTFISFPAGIARMNVVQFSLYTFLGSLPWCYGLAFVGLKLGSRWTTLRSYFHHADLVIGGLLILGFAFFLYHHIKPEKCKVEKS